MLWIVAQHYMILAWQLVRPWTLHQRNRFALRAATFDCRLACTLTCTMVRALCSGDPDAFFSLRFPILSLQAATKYMELMISCWGIDLSSWKQWAFWKLQQQVWYHVWTYMNAALTWWTAFLEYCVEKLVYQLSWIRSGSDDLTNFDLFMTIAKFLVELTMHHMLMWH